MLEAKKMKYLARVVRSWNFEEQRGMFTNEQVYREAKRRLRHTYKNAYEVGWLSREQFCILESWKCPYPEHEELFSKATKIQKLKYFAALLERWLSANTTTRELPLS